jgi:hypothetical protein
MINCRRYFYAESCPSAHRLDPGELDQRTLTADSHQHAPEPEDLLRIHVGPVDPGVPEVGDLGQNRGKRITNQLPFSSCCRNCRWSGVLPRRRWASCPLER